MDKDTIGVGSIIRSYIGTIYLISSIDNDGVVMYSVISNKRAFMSLNVFLRKLENGYLTIPNGLEYAINLSQIKKSGYNISGD